MKTVLMNLLDNGRKAWRAATPGKEADAAGASRAGRLCPFMCATRERACRRQSLAGSRKPFIWWINPAPGSRAGGSGTVHLCGNRKASWRQTGFSERGRKRNAGKGMAAGADRGGESMRRKNCRSRKSWLLTVGALLLAASVGFGVPLLLRKWQDDRRLSVVETEEAAGRCGLRPRQSLAW